MRSFPRSRAGRNTFGGDTPRTGSVFRLVRLSRQRHSGAESLLHSCASAGRRLRSRQSFAERHAKKLFCGMLRFCVLLSLLRGHFERKRYFSP